MNQQQQQQYDPNYYYQQNPAVAPAPPPVPVAQHPVSVGQEATTNDKSSAWKTAALWVAGVAGATIVSYFVTKALVKAEEKVANARSENPEPQPLASLPRQPEAIPPTINGGSADDFSEIRNTMKEALSRLSDVEAWVHSQGGKR